MTDEEVLYPDNSRRKKQNSDEEKKVERVTTAEPIRRKKGLAHKFKSIFFGGDPRSTMNFIVQSVLIPAAKDMIIDAAREGVEKLVRGDSYRRHRPPSSGASGYVAYNRMGPSRGPIREPESRTMSRNARAKHDFDEIVLQSRAEAEEVIERMFDICAKYDTATVSDLYDLVGIRSTHVDHKWGWSDMRGAGVARVRDGYLLELPDIQPMEM
jgi:hypothetical protein